MFNIAKRLKGLFVTAAVLILGVTALPVLPQVAKADPPFDCTDCRYPWKLEDSLYFHRLSLNRYDSPFEYTGTAINEDEWVNNVVWTDLVTAKPDWTELNSGFYANIGHEERLLRPIYDDEDYLTNLRADATEALDRVAVAETDIDDLQIAVGAISVPDDLGDLAPGSDSNHFTDADEAKLDGIAAGATANDSNAALRARSSHTGTQSADTVTDGTTNKVLTAAMATKLGDLPTAATLTSSFASKFNTPSGTTSQVVLGDGSLGTLPTATVYYDNTTQRTGVRALFKSGVVGDVTAGNVVYYLSSDNTATGTALCPNNVFLDGLQLRAQEGTTPHAFGTAALSNSNRTLTVPVSKIAPILGILNLNQAATGTTVKATVYCN